MFPALMLILLIWIILGVMEQSLMEIRTMAVSSTITTDNATRLDIASQINSKIELFIEEEINSMKGNMFFQVLQ